MAQEENNNQDPVVETPTTAGEVKTNISEEHKDLKLDETFLPESQVEETPAAPAEGTPPATTTPTVESKKEEVTPPATPAVETPPAGDQPNNSQNAEIVDKTGTQPDKLYAGKYKSVDDLKHGIEELGGDPSGIEDPVQLEQAYLAVQKVYNRMTTRNEKVDEITKPKEEAKPFEVTDDLIENMMNELDFTKIENAKDMAKQQFAIMFKHMKELLPQMLPPQAPGQQMDPVEMAAVIDRANTNTDSLAYIEAKIPRLVSDQNFRRNFAMHLKAGKESKTYPQKMTREDMTGAMKDFLKTASDMAAEASKLDGAQQQQNQEDKGGAATPDGGGTPASTQTAPDPEADLLDSIVGAKEEQDKKLLFQ